MLDGATNVRIRMNQPHLTQEEARDVLEKYGINDIIALKPLPSYEDQNFHVTAKDADDVQHDYVLKIMNNVKSQNPDICSVQSHAMTFLRECGFPTPMTFHTIGGEMLSFFSIESENGPKRYIVRLLEYMPGVPLARVAVELDMFYKLGSLIAFMNLTLQDFKPSSENYFDPNSLWNMSNLLKLIPLVKSLDGNSIQKLVHDVLQVCASSMLPQLPYFRSGPIHGDLNDDNILVEECTEDVNQTTHMSLVHSPKICPTSKNYNISGIIDFADIFPGFYVSELAILMVYMMLNHPEKIVVGGHVMAGYESVMPLTGEEKDSLFFAVISRIVISIVLCQHEAKMSPENAKFLLRHDGALSSILKELWEAGKEKVEKLWFDVADLYSTTRQASSTRLYNYNH
uniref:hydroxylysine kinase-like isoform X1 n=2 Tax=Myxine glutinosa TaxID=7769 RepID=UPI00358E4855